ncbi:hypothetical protein H4Q26_007085 [Puccinia striiformis f. sp. tritici PST-130]|nr:hypothetical protein H4Q26_007085 [Puccinia striiformis f. sp. tritici PST-130]
MVVTIVFQIALSCGVVLLYSFIGSCFLNCLGFRRRSEDQAEEKEEEEEEEVAQSDLSNGSELSNDAIHLLRLTNAFCPPKNSPLIFGRDVNNPREDSYYSEDEEDFGEDTFSDVLEESSFCLRDSFEHGHSRRISIKPPAFIHEASVAEIATDHKSTSSARRSSTTFAPEMHHHENEKVNRLFSLITKDKKKKLFTVRPSISALRRFNQSKQVHQVDQQKLPSNANRIDYMSSVRTRFKLISSKKLSLKPANKAIGPTGRVDIRRQPDYDGRRMSSVLFGTA